jgi:biopolymer transport protein ExbB
MKEYFINGGFMMYPLALCSIIALTVIIERFFSYQGTFGKLSEVVKKIRAALAEGNPTAAINACAESGTPMSIALASGIQRKDRPKEVIMEAMERTGRQEISRLERGLVWLATIANIAPLLGFLGTVTGMIDSFGAIAAKGLGDPRLVASGISEALITTATGLAIAVPALIFYNYFSRRADRVAAQIEDGAHELIEIIETGRAGEA